jgi:hypothetical protein
MAHTVGEMQGEMQIPPESKRRGRRCWLVQEEPYTTLEKRYDSTLGMWVVYADHA